MSLEDFGNPAYRLWRFLNFASEYEGSQPIRTVVSDYFGLDNGEPGTTYDPRMLRGIAELLELPPLIDAAVHARSVNSPPAAMVLRPMERIEPALRYLAGIGQHKVSSLLGGYSDRDLADLEHCIYYIDNPSQAKIDRDKLDELRKLTDELLGFVEDSGDDLDESLRQFVYDQTTKISDAVRLARAAGNGLLQSTLDEALGRLLRSAPTRESLKQNPTVADRFWTIMNRLLIVSQIGTVAFALPTAVSDILPIENPPAVVAPGDVQDAREV